jgi:cytochrome c-type biogenesis protein CcsB
MRLLPILLFTGLIVLGPSVVARAADAEPDSPLPYGETAGWAILADGRVKPLLTYANETALALTGRESLAGLSSLELLWGYVLAPDDFRTRPYIKVDSLELKERMGLQSDQRRWSFHALLEHPEFRAVVEVALKRQAEERELTRLEDDALGVYAKLGRVAALMNGSALMLVPVPAADGGWATPASLAAADRNEERAVSQGFATLAEAHAAGDADAFRAAVDGLTASLRAANPDLYPAQSTLDRELFYEGFNAFGKAWMLYLAGFLLVLLLGLRGSPRVYALGMLLLGAGFLCHSAGLGLRWAIAGRAPVSNMYESLVFMGWGAIALGLILEAVYRPGFFALVSGLVGFLCLAFAENLPIDSSINPLVPVLAHTSWLAIHVMTIMLSYSAFALAMVLGHVALLVQLRQPSSARVHALSALLYQTLKVGLLFLAAGIICGAVWANESWGRYWGWDPKETWSLITLFVYLAVVHGRFAGWLRDFGLAASAIIGFLAVIMTYYGVNFVLAAGLHSYGFASGGQVWMLLFVVVEVVVVAAAFLGHRRSLVAAAAASAS